MLQHEPISTTERAENTPRTGRSKIIRRVAVAVTPLVVLAAACSSTERIAGDTQGANVTSTTQPNQTGTLPYENRNKLKSNEEYIAEQKKKIDEAINENKPVDYLKGALVMFGDKKVNRPARVLLNPIMLPKQGVDAPDLSRPNDWNFFELNVTGSSGSGPSQISAEQVKPDGNTFYGLIFFQTQEDAPNPARELQKQVLKPSKSLDYGIDDLCDLSPSLAQGNQTVFPPQGSVCIALSEGIVRAEKDSGPSANKPVGLYIEFTHSGMGGQVGGNNYN